MCGFGIIVNRACPVDLHALSAIGAAMAMRGPDASGEWLSPNQTVGMVHRRLSIIDLSPAANQPMKADHGTVISFNGEIYNYMALRQELQRAGYVFHTHSDTEVLLHGYLHWGTALPERLQGMFAFAIWDARDNSVFLARDHFGIKPLYYFNQGGLFVAASSTQAVMASGLVPKSHSAAGLASFFLWGNVSDPYTVYEGVSSLPAGHAMRVDGTGHAWPQKYWSVSDCLAQAGERQVSLDDTVSTLRTALKESVQRHMVSDVPVGFFLSAGRDSSALVGLAAELGINVQAITLGFREFANSERDEVELAGIVARSYHCAHHVQWMSREQFGAHEERFFTAMDQPTIDAVNTYFVSKAAADQGLKVVISGLGGDEILGGYPSFQQVPSIVRAVTNAGLPASLGTMLRQIFGGLVGRFTSPKYAGLLEYGGTWGGAYMLRRSLYMPWELPALIGSDVAKEGLHALRTQASADAIAAQVPGDHAKVAAMELSLYMRNMLLRDSDWASMAHSLELRVPFVDVALLQALAPLMTSSASACTKGDLVNCPTPSLPAAVAARPKTGFEVPLREWMHQPQSAAERGLRGWSQYVGRRFGLPMEDSAIGAGGMSARLL